MDNVPTYLGSLLSSSRAGMAEYVISGPIESGVRAAADAATNALTEWSSDDDFWETLSAELQASQASPIEGDLTDVHLDEEVRALEPHLGKDRAQATAIALQLLGRSGGDAETARNAVAQAAQEGAALEEGPEESRLLRTGRFLRKAARFAIGGVAIAADIVSPDPSALTKIASIAGGVWTITGG